MLQYLFMSDYNMLTLNLFLPLNIIFTVVPRLSKLLAGRKKLSLSFSFCESKAIKADHLLWPDRAFVFSTKMQGSGFLASSSGVRDGQGGNETINPGKVCMAFLWI